MAWQIPQSQTVPGIVANLLTTHDVFVASGVTIASTGATTIEGTGSNHEVLVYGTVANPTAPAIALGDNGTLDSGESVTIKPGGQVHSFGNSVNTVSIDAFASQITNQGLIAAPNGHGIVLSGNNVATVSTIVNSGTIDVGQTAIITSFNAGTTALQNSGSIFGDAAAYSGGASARDLITNTGKMVGDLFLSGGNDVYNGAQGRLTGEVHAGDGVDVITCGKDNDVIFGDADNDTLRGGLGKDSLTGGTGRDFFDFNSKSESVKGANRDVILDFSRPADDRIDLRTIAADTSTNPGNDAFKFIGKDAFEGGGRELRYIDKGAFCIAQGDINGDKVADFEIRVNIGSLVSGDFFL